MITDDAVGGVGTLTAGSAGSLSNSQCTISNLRISSGSDLALTADIAFSAGYSGAKTVTMWPYDRMRTVIRLASGLS